MIRVGLVGCGTIGTQLALALQHTYPHVSRITALHDADPTRALALSSRLRARPPVVSLSVLIRRSQLVLEAASADAAREVIHRALRANRHVFIMSVGGLLRDRSWQRLARRGRSRVYIPSGALAGLDGVKALALGPIRSLSLTTRKPPHALQDAPYVRRRGLRLERLRRPTVIFEGSPRAAVAAFPQNTNVAAALTLAGGRAGAKTRVRVVADPTIRRNIHEVDVEGSRGRLRCRIESAPSANPKTSELAVQSAVATLGRIFDPIAIGT